MTRGVSNAVFDPLAATGRLRDAGFDEAQAETLASEMREAVTESAATKADAAELKADMTDLEARLETRIEPAVDCILPVVFGAAGVASLRLSSICCRRAMAPAAAVAHRAAMD